MIFFGSLMWIDEKNHSAINNKSKKIESYFKQIDVLNKTLIDSQKTALTVFSNQPLLIENWFVSRGKTPPNFISISASYEVPPGTPFFSAHYKLDAIAAGRALLKSSSDRFILLDADEIAIRPFTKDEMRKILDSDLIVYDISSQVFPAYGAGKIRADLKLINNLDSSSQSWYGGEFICASKSGLDRLLQEARKILPTYLLNISTLHHIGDEMFISAALNVIRDAPNDLIISEQGPHKLITRHWSRFATPTIDEHLQSAFLHLPGSKPLLEILSNFNKPLQTPLPVLLKVYSLLVRMYQKFKLLKH